MVMDGDGRLMDLTASEHKHRDYSEVLAERKAFDELVKARKDNFLERWKKYPSTWTAVTSTDGRAQRADASDEEKEREAERLALEKAEEIEEEQIKEAAAKKEKEEHDVGQQIAQAEAEEKQEAEADAGPEDAASPDAKGGAAKTPSSRPGSSVATPNPVFTGQGTRRPPPRAPKSLQPEAHSDLDNDSDPSI